MTTKFAQHHPGKGHAVVARSLDRLGTERAAHYGPPSAGRPP
ncbi:hypothetical protein ACH4FX_30530 [Streptomyces sp. NPDC018019]